MEPVYRSVIGVAQGLFAFQGLRFTVTGGENIPLSGGAVLSMNHVGYFDFTYAGYAALPRKRLVRFMAKAEVFDHPVAGPLMRGMHHIPVDRAAGAASFRRAVEDLRAGEIVGVFPEATISRSFELKDFKTGAARMAIDAGVPVLPTILWGSQRVWTKDHPKRLGRTKVPIHVAVGEPVAPEGSPEELMAVVRTRMQGLLEQVQHDYPESPAGAFWLPARLGGGAPTPEEAVVLEREETKARVARRREKVAELKRRGTLPGS